mgnify:CR=1 FL=1
MGNVFNAAIQGIKGIGGATQEVAGGFTPQNQYQAQTILSPEIAQQAEKQFGGISTQQQALANALLAQSQGQGPNLAAEQTRQALQQAQAQQAGAIASQKGISPALAARLASQGSAQMRAQAAGQAGLTQAQQQLGAQQAFPSRSRLIISDRNGKDLFGFCNQKR